MASISPDIIRNPYIGTNGNWYVWDSTAYAFVDSGISATSGDSIRYTAQTLTDEQRAQALGNIAAQALVSSPTDGHIVTTDENGQGEDSGHAISELGALSSLITSDKTSHVNAINEIKEQASALASGSQALVSSPTDGHIITTNASGQGEDSGHPITDLEDVIADVGDKTNLNTTAKTNLVSAINELAAMRGVTILGTYADLTALRAAVLSPSVGDLYNIGASAPYNVYRATGLSNPNDWEDMGTLTATTAANLPIVDAGNHFDSSEVEGALQEVGSQLAENAKKGAIYPFQPLATFTYGSSGSSYDLMKRVKYIKIYGWNADKSAKFHFKRIWNADSSGATDATKLRIEICRDGSANYFECAATVNVVDVTGKFAEITFASAYSSGITALIVMDFTDGNTVVDSGFSDSTRLTYDAAGFDQRCIASIDAEELPSGSVDYYPFADKPSDTRLTEMVKDIRVNAGTYTGDLTVGIFTAYVSGQFELRLINDSGSMVVRFVKTGITTAGRYVIASDSVNSIYDGTVIIDVTDLTPYQKTLNQKISESCIHRESDYAVVLPSVIPVVSGKGLKLYYDNMITCFTGREWLFYATNASLLAKRWASFSTSTVGDTTISVWACPVSTRKPVSASTTKRVVSASAGSGTTKKVMLIGDSKEAAGVKASELLNLFSGDVMAIQEVGTLTGTVLDADGDSRTVYHEGRSSWGVLHYYNYASYAGFTNPFYNPSTGVFDFAYYLAQNPTVEAPDIVFIDLGTNDGGATYSSMKTAYDAIIQSIHAYDADISVVIALQEGESTRDYQSGSGTVPSKAVLSHIASLISDYDGQESSKIFLCPQYVIFDLENDFPMTDQAVSSRNPHTEITVTDKIHPSVYGYYKLADMRYNVIKYIASL